MSISLVIDLDGNRWRKRSTFRGEEPVTDFGYPPPLLHLLLSVLSERKGDTHTQKRQLFFRRGLARYFRRMKGEGSKGREIVNLLEESETMVGEERRRKRCWKEEVAVNRIIN
ncbi:UNVERIFIED_CONTAM: hypothetical protein PYX00_009236 [Menopon gallinae]|uniref:Uncharacterized protein n=1 Tax=Menopon gallinae TaxID=328185 RepID=A0AAW2HAS2_9NEOP